MLRAYSHTYYIITVDYYFAWRSTRPREQDEIEEAIWNRR